MYNENEFAVLILSHGRPDNVITYKSIRRAGYKGKIYIVCDNDDKTIESYRDEYGEYVVTFSKNEYEGRFDKMDNFGNRGVVVYARNAVYDIAKKLGLKYFCVLDDDYTVFQYRVDGNGNYGGIMMKNADNVFGAYIEYLRETKISTVCFAQGGDYIGGKNNANVKNGFKVSRKMMNVYFFSVDKRMEFIGTINEDLTSSITEGIKGNIILTNYMNSITQKETQQNKGGLTEAYLELGTYVKSFYSVMAAPSCVKVALMGDKSTRLHHQVNWKCAVPKIIRAK